MAIKFEGVVIIQLPKLHPDPYVSACATQTMHVSSITNRAGCSSTERSLYKPTSVDFRVRNQFNHWSTSCRSGC